MLVRIFSYLICFICVVAIYGLFAIKDKVGTLTYQYNEVSRQVIREQDTIHILKAEFAYLTAPDRLRKLANNYLQLDSIKTSQMIKNPLISNIETIQPLTEVSNINLVKRNIRWRYKRAPSKYLQTVSHKR